MVITMSEEIESLYRQGEHCAGTGQYHDALANFHKAKSLLLSQSYQNFSSQNHSSSSSKLGVMMESITKSINRNTEILVKNPILALYLSRGYNTDDLKKKYRSLALQFHPDKNKDYDSSSIFTIIQGAYEKLKSISVMDKIKVPVPQTPPKPNQYSTPRSSVSSSNRDNNRKSQSARAHTSSPSSGPVAPSTIPTSRSTPYSTPRDPYTSRSNNPKADTTTSSNYSNNIRCSFGHKPSSTSKSMQTPPSTTNTTHSPTRNRNIDASLHSHNPIVTTTTNMPPLSHTPPKHPNSDARKRRGLLHKYSTFLAEQSNKYKHDMNSPFYGIDIDFSDLHVSDTTDRVSHNSSRMPRPHTNRFTSTTTTTATATAPTSSTTAKNNNNSNGSRNTRTRDATTGPTDGVFNAFDKLYESTNTTTPTPHPSSSTPSTSSCTPSTSSCTPSTSSCTPSTSSCTPSTSSSMPNSARYNQSNLEAMAATIMREWMDQLSRIQDHDISGSSSGGVSMNALLASVNKNEHRSTSCYTQPDRQKQSQQQPHQDNKDKSTYQREVPIDTTHARTPHSTATYLPSTRSSTVPTKASRVVSTSIDKKSNLNRKRSDTTTQSQKPSTSLQSTRQPPLSTIPPRRPYPSFESVLPTIPPSIHSTQPVSTCNLNSKEARSINTNCTQAASTLKNNNRGEYNDDSDNSMSSCGEDKYCIDNEYQKLWHERDTCGEDLEVQLPTPDSSVAYEFFVTESI